MRKVILWAVLLTVMASLPALAGNSSGAVIGPGGDPPLPIGGGWQYDQDISSAIGPDVLGGWSQYGYVWSLAVGATPVNVTVTDAFLNGDIYGLWDVGAGGFVMTTPVPAGQTVATINTFPWEGNPDVAVTQAHFAHGSVVLPAGNYNLQIKDFLIAGGPPQTAISGWAGTAMDPAGVYIRADLVPEPGTMTLLGIATFGLLPFLRRRRQA